MVQQTLKEAKSAAWIAAARRSAGSWRNMVTSEASNPVVSVLAWRAMSWQADKQETGHAECKANGEFKHGAPAEVTAHKAG